MKKNRRRLFLVVILMLIEVISLALMYKSAHNKEIVLDEVKLINETNNNMFSIMTDETGSGSYKEYSGNSWPSSNNNYVLNKSQTKCMNEKGDTVSTSYVNFTDDKIELRNTSQGMHCTLYFDVSLGTLTFTIAEGTETAILGSEMPFTATWTMKGAKKYCLSTESTSDKCYWADLPAGTTNSFTSGPLTGTLGTYTVYFYLQDAVGHVKGTSDSIKIIEPDYPPKITKFATTSILPTSVAVEVAASDDNGISKYCYSYKSTSVTSYGTEECHSKTATTDTYTFTGLAQASTYDFRVRVFDTKNQTATEQILKIQTTTAGKPACGISVSKTGISLMTSSAVSWYLSKGASSNPSYGTSSTTLTLEEGTFYGYVKNSIGETATCSTTVLKANTKQVCACKEFLCSSSSSLSSFPKECLPLWLDEESWNKCLQNSSSSGWGMCDMSNPSAFPTCSTGLYGLHIEYESCTDDYVNCPSGYRINGTIYCNVPN